MALLGNLTGSAPFFQDAGSFYNNAILTSYRNDNASDAYLYGNKGGNGDRQTFTISWWMKIGTSLTGTIYTSGFSGSGASASSGHIITSSNKVRMQNQVNNSAEWTLDSTRLFRDASAWYNCVLAVDTTQGTEANRIKLYVNGVQETLSGSYPSQNANLRMNNQYEKIGTWDDGGNRYFDFDGYFADFNLIDGTQLDASSFGEFKNGVWIPVDTSSLTRGTKGWRLQFKQVGVGTASSSTVGADTGGNDFHFTSSGIVASDCAMPDSPENNFATLNPLQIGQSNWTLSEGNLKGISSTSVSGGGGVLSTMGVSSGKWYWECLLQNLNSDASEIGIANTKSIRTDVTLGRTSDSYAYLNNGNKFSNNSSSSYGATYTTGDIIGVALDLDGATLTFYKNNATQGTAFSSLPSGHYVMGVSEGSTGNQQTQILNFGQDSSFAGNETAQGNTDANGIGDFAYAPPSGYLALCSANLPEPTISPNADEQADDYFNTVLYTGTGSSNAITGVGFQPDWLWIKQRNTTRSHRVLSSSMFSHYLATDNANSQSTNDVVSSLDSDGFTLLSPSSVNQSGGTYVAWNWKVNGGTTSSNTDGSITSTVQANTTAGFSIVSYNGNATASTIGHGLNKTPAMIIVKERGGARPWVTYHASNTSAPETDYLRLNETNGTADYDMWNDTAPTSSVFSVSSYDWVNNNASPFISYVFAEIEGYSKFGSYTGNGSTDGTFVYTGFRPAWLMVKRTDTLCSWVIVDSVRDPINVAGKRIFADSSASEYTNVDNPDLVSNGFKVRIGSTDNCANASGGTYIYMAFAETPTKYSLAR